MAAGPYLRRRGSRHFFRMWIPYPLRAALGRQEVTRALGTSDPQTARRRCARTLVAIQAGLGIMEDLHRTRTTSDAEQQALFERLVDQAIAEPRALIENEPALREIDDPQTLRARFVDILDGVRERLEARRAEHARAEAAEREARARAERQATAASDQAEALRQSMVQLTSAGVGQPIELYAGHDQPVAALKDAFLERKALKPKTEKSYRKAFARFEAVVGDKPISEITRNDVVRFVEDLEATHSDKRERAPLDPQTTQKYISHIK